MVFDARSIHVSHGPAHELTSRIFYRCLDAPSSTSIQKRHILRPLIAMSSQFLGICESVDWTQDTSRSKILENRFAYAFEWKRKQWISCVNAILGEQNRNSSPHARVFVCLNVSSSTPEWCRMFAWYHIGLNLMQSFTDVVHFIFMTFLFLFLRYWHIQWWSVIGHAYGDTR